MGAADAAEASRMGWETAGMVNSGAHGDAGDACDALRYYNGASQLQCNMFAGHE